MRLNRFAVYAWGVLAVNLLVILWGALVRATGSGAGCGSHWPTCQGAVIPLTGQVETLIEFTHRLTSGLALLLVVIMLVWAWRRYPKGHAVRLAAGFSMGLIIVEALVGAGLVLFELVAYDDSVARAVVVALHLVNTYLLLSALTLTAWWASGGVAGQLGGQGWLGRGLLLGYGGLLLLGASGAVTALGDTLFPVTTLSQGLRQDFSPTAHFLIQLRLYHPLIAVVVGAYLLLMAGLCNIKQPRPAGRGLAGVLLGIYLTQLAVGVINVLLLAPIWMQLLHLFLSDLILITLVLFMATVFARPQAQESDPVGPIVQPGQQLYG